FSENSAGIEWPRMGGRAPSDGAVNVTRHGRPILPDREADTAAPGEGPEGRAIRLREGVCRLPAIHGLPGASEYRRQTLARRTPRDHAISFPVCVYPRVGSGGSNAPGVATL